MAVRVPLENQGSVRVLDFIRRRLRGNTQGLEWGSGWHGELAKRVELCDEGAGMGARQDEDSHRTGRG